MQGRRGERMGWILLGPVLLATTIAAAPNGGVVVSGHTSTHYLSAAGLFDEVIVAAVRNPQKGDGFFTLEERQDVIRETFEHLPNVTVTIFSSLVVDLAKEHEADFIIKGLRAVSDFESELQMAQMNEKIQEMTTTV